MKKIMILGASILQLPAIQCAKQMGLEVIVVDMNPDAVGFKEEGIIKEIISTIDTNQILEAAKRHNINGIMTLASDMPMRTVALVANELGLVGITEQTALNATNKAMMRECLQVNSVPIPEFYKISTYDEFMTVVDNFKSTNRKCIIKPVDNSGSRGVDLLSNYENKLALKQAFEYCREYSRSGDIIIEEYMEGPEVSVETLSINGVCHVIQITDKLTTGAPYFVEMGHNEPSLLPIEVRQRIAEVAAAAVKAIGIKDGPSHTEIKVTKEGPKIVELGARLGGDNITSHLVPLSTGVNMVECCIRIALGEHPDLDKKYDKCAAIRYFNTKNGIIKKITGIEEVRMMEGIIQVSMVHDVGSMAREIKNSVDRVGFVISQSDDVNCAIDICESAMKKIKIEVGKLD